MEMGTNAYEMREENQMIDNNVPVTNNKIKLLICYHKPSYLLKDEVLTPIHVGRANAKKRNKNYQKKKKGMSSYEKEIMSLNSYGFSPGYDLWNHRLWFQE